MIQTNLFGNPKTTALILLDECNGHRATAKAVALRLVDRASRSGGCYGLRRHYCKVYIELLLSEPVRAIEAPKPHFSTFKN